MTLAFPVRPLCLALTAVAALTACGSLSQVTGEETVDYRTPRFDALPEVADGLVPGVSALTARSAMAALWAWRA